MHFVVMLLLCAADSTADSVAHFAAACLVLLFLFLTHCVPRALQAGFNSPAPNPPATLPASLMAAFAATNVSGFDNGTLLTATDAPATLPDEAPPVNGSSTGGDAVNSTSQPSVQSKLLSLSVKPDYLAPQSGDRHLQLVHHQPGATRQQHWQGAHRHRGTQVSAIIGAGRCLLAVLVPAGACVCGQPQRATWCVHHICGPCLQLRACNTLKCICIKISLRCVTQIRYLCVVVCVQLLEPLELHFEDHRFC